MSLVAAELLVRVDAETDPAEGKLKGFGGKLDGMARSFGATGAMMSAAITAPFLGAAAVMAKRAGGMEQTMNMVQAATQATAAQMAAMQEQALQLGAATSFSANEAAAGMLELGKAGMSVDEIMAAMPGVTNLAAAAGTDLGSAAALSSAALNAFGLNADQATRIADLLAAGANASAAEITDLGAGLQQAGFAFASTGQPVEDLVTSLAALTNVGLTGSDAGTALKNAMIRLTAPTKEARGVMNSLGLSFFDANGDMLGMREMIGQLNTAMAGMTQEHRLAALETIFMSDGMKAMLPLLDLGVSGWDSLSEAVTQQGAAAAMADARMKGFLGGLEYMWGSIEGAMTKTALPFLDWLGDGARRLGDLATEFTNIDPAIQSAILAFGGVMAAVGPILLGVAGAAKALAFLVTPIGLISVAVAGLAAAYVANWGGIQEKTAAVWAAIKPTLQEWQTWLTATLPGAFAAMQDAAQAAWATIKDVFSGKTTLPELVQKVAIEWVIPALPALKDAAQKMSPPPSPLTPFNNVGDAFADLPWADYVHGLTPAVTDALKQVEVSDFGTRMGTAVGTALKAAFEADGATAYWEGWVREGKMAAAKMEGMEWPEDVTNPQSWKAPTWMEDLQSWWDGAVVALDTQTTKFADALTDIFPEFPKPGWIADLETWLNTNPAWLDSFLEWTPAWLDNFLGTATKGGNWPEDVTNPKIRDTSSWNDVFERVMGGIGRSLQYAPMLNASVGDVPVTAMVQKLDTSLVAGGPAGEPEVFVNAIVKKLDAGQAEIPLDPNRFMGPYASQYYSAGADKIGAAIGTQATALSGALSGFVWPDLPKWTWPALPNWTWPPIQRPSWISQMTVPRPGWLGELLSWAPIVTVAAGGVPGNAGGTSWWPGGLSWVGEEGPELVNLPRGAQVFDAQASRGMATVNNYFTINTNGDALSAEALAVRVARIIGRRA